jgi:uncharacterized protein
VTVTFRLTTNTYNPYHVHKTAFDTICSPNLNREFNVLNTQGVKMKFASSLRDPVYGVVPITSIEQEILKLPLMNRLKNIKQLGLAYLAFAGANHTRFEHCVGTMHVASLMGTAIELNEQELETIRIAALLHDVGHPPFSHSIEFACNLFGIKEIPNHECTTKKRIKGDDKLNEILKRNRPLIHIEDVASLAIGEFKTPYLRRIIDGAIDADKIDYILRDNYHCGLPVALDINTISEILSRDTNLGIVIKPEGQSFAEQLFIGRYHLVSKIHHNLRNRLGNYLLALTLKEAWDNSKDKENVAQKMTEEWTDGDLMAFLQKEATTKYPILRNHLLGTEVFHEVRNFGFENLTPLARYSAAKIASCPSVLPKVSKTFSSWFKNKQFFIDTYIANPPEPNITLGTNPPLLLIDAPLSRAALDASLKEIHFAVYSLEDIEDKDIDFDKLLKQYSEMLDSTLDTKKAESLIKMWWNNDKTSFCIQKLAELVLNTEAIAMRSGVDFTSDLIILAANAIYESFANIYKQIVFIPSLTELAIILGDLEKEGFFKRKDGTAMTSYPLSFSKGGTFSTEFLVDMEMLETFGLLYRLIRVSKFGEQYHQKYQIRISGWGRAYFQRNLNCVQDMLSLSIRLNTYFQRVIKEKEEQYNELFRRAKEEPTTKETSQQAKKIIKDLPVPIIVLT